MVVQDIVIFIFCFNSLLHHCYYYYYNCYFCCFYFYQIFLHNYHKFYHVKDNDDTDNRWNPNTLDSLFLFRFSDPNTASALTFMCTWIICRLLRAYSTHWLLIHRTWMEQKNVFWRKRKSGLEWFFLAVSPDKTFRGIILPPKKIFPHQ